MVTYALDFESYYDSELSLKKLGTQAYIEHPDVDFYLVSVYTEGFSYVGSLQDFEWTRLNGCRVVAHNQGFDRTAFVCLQEEGIIPAECQPAEWRCTADLAVAISAPRSLQGAITQLFNTQISKKYRSTALGKRWQEFSEEEQQEIKDAGEQDAKYCWLLWHHFNSAWPADEQMLSEVTWQMGYRGVRVDIPEVEKSIKDLELILWKAGEKIPWDWGGSISKTPNSPKKIALECRRVGIPFPASFAKDNEEAVEWEAKYGKEFRWIQALNTWRTSNGFLTKLKAIRTRVRTDETIPAPILYQGAHTGRFSGTGGVNFQNLPRDPKFGINMRNLLVPRVGNKFLIVDYRQVEARILAWQAGMEHTLQLIRSGLSIYEAHARDTMGWDPKKGPLEPSKYMLAKARVLALGYGCGYLKFQVMAKTLCGLSLSLEECEQTVADFRRSNPEICSLWKTLHAQMNRASRTPARAYRMKLPSGRTLDYFNVNVLDGMKAQVIRGGSFYNQYGGRLVENLCQAIGRDILKDATLACYEQIPEYPVALSVHDELVFDVPNNISDAEVSRIERIMTQASPWAAGLPTEVESELTDHYKK